MLKLSVLAMVAAVAPLWQPSILQQLGCDEEQDQAAAPEDRPVAVCNVSEEEINPIFDQVSFHGRESWDPNGHEIIDYNWRLVTRPSGSAARIPGEGADRYGFVPDMVGEYVAELVVTNDQCVMSPPCQVSVKAIPAEDLWVEMHWQHSGDDMDLHLLEGSAALESNGDCYFGNCVGGGPDWGRPGNGQDDPGLDLDDIEGTGPENINIYDPQPGTYTVVVHDYPGSTYQNANAVTVKIHLAGELVFEDTHVIQGEDDYEYFAVIHWPSME
ncbi:MAG: hypothetical protein JRI25_28535, partial [Deltaproteobacteria bacterium]|nr:hypothetical protein [Deltaproteobacteria bacterium]